jgi:menaquinone-dependent protoporphyrinogen IX oxidase
LNAIVVFFSRDGTTRKVAQAIGDRLHCEVEEITEPKGRKGFLGFMRSGYQAYRQKASKINPIVAKVKRFDIVVVGTPVWAGRLSSPVRAFLVKHGKGVRKVAFFCTKASSESSKVFGAMESLTGKAPVSILDLKKEEVDKHTYYKKLNDFLRKIRNV